MPTQTVPRALELLEFVRLTPEGDTYAAHRRLSEALLARGHRIFSFSYHSPSLVPGNTPYVRNDADLRKFFDTMRRYFDYFFGELNGIALTPVQLYERLCRGEQGEATS